MEHNNLWQALLREVQRKKENNYVFCEYRVHLKSGDFIIQIKGIIPHALLNLLLKSII